MRMTIAAVLAVLVLDASAVDAKGPGVSARQKRPIRSVLQRRLAPQKFPVPATIVAPPVQMPAPQMVRTFVVELHEITQDDYDRATKGRDFRLASVGMKPRPHLHFEMRGQGDVFTGWTSGMEMPYESGGARRYEFVGTVGEVQPSDQPGFRRLMLKDSRLVRFYDFKDSAGKRGSIPVVRKSEIALDFPLNGQERSQVYAIPKGKNKFEYRLLTVREDADRRRLVMYLDASGMP